MNYRPVREEYSRFGFVQYAWERFEKPSNYGVHFFSDVHIISPRGIFTRDTGKAIRAFTHHSLEDVWFFARYTLCSKFDPSMTISQNWDKADRKDRRYAWERGVPADVRVFLPRFFDVEHMIGAEIETQIQIAIAQKDEVRQ